MKRLTRLSLCVWLGHVTLALGAESIPDTTSASSGTQDADLIAVTRLLDAARPTQADGFKYSADRFIDHVDGDSLVLEGHAVVLHRGARLEASRMVFFRDRHLIFATGVTPPAGDDDGRGEAGGQKTPQPPRQVGRDTVTDSVQETSARIDSPPADPTGPSAQGPVDSNTASDPAAAGPGTAPAGNRPRLSRGDDILEGDSILYDTNSGEGWISDGRIAHDDGYFSGYRIRARSEKEFLVGAGSYTTCDADHPHFDFYSPRIKVLVGDMAIARPVYFRIAENRLLWIPFYVFSLREDRQSGVLTPGFGRRPLSFGSTTTEWEVRNLGYYFAPSDYWDLTLAADLRQQTGWVGRAAFDYAWRYHFNGAIEGRVQNRQEGDLNQRAWWLSLRHRQQLSDSANLQGSGTFQGSQDFQRDNGTNLDDRLNRTLRSNIRYDKRWRDAGWSLSAGASQTKNLDSGISDVVLPEVSLRANRKALFGDAGRDGPWYTRVYYDGNARLRNTRQTTPTRESLSTRADASVRLSTQQRPVDWLNLNSSINSSWRDQNLRSGSEEGVRTDQFSTSATLSQTVYGLFHPRLGPVTALRHVLKPDVGLTFDASRADSGGVGFSGRTRPWDTNRRLTFRLSNSLWAKYLKGPDGEEEGKARLAQLNLSTSYDFDRDVRPLSDLVTSLTLEGGRRFNSRVSLRSEFYDDENRLQDLPRIRQFEVTTTMRAVPQRTRPDRGNDTSRNQPAGSSNGQDEFGFESGLQEDIGDRDRGRSFLISHYYSRRRSLAGINQRSWLRASVGTSVTRVWHLNYSVNYNLHAPGLSLTQRDRITAELLSIQREFHDWTATLNVEPSRLARDRAFYFKAQFKEIPQLRFERGDRRGIGT